MGQYLLAIDQGTTSTRSIVFDNRGDLVAVDSIPLEQHFPANGWVEHDPKEIWHGVLQTMRNVVHKTNIHVKEIAGIGITNQRETTVVWDRETSQPIYPAIVWQDRRTHELCKHWVAEGRDSRLQAITGLVVDPYFSAPKLAWILDRVPQARIRASQGRLAFGTIDSYLVWCLTRGRSHITDITNASRTMLFDIHQQCWSNECLRLFNIPDQLLPLVTDNCGELAFADKEWLGAELPITGLAGDQQAALVGQGCFKAGQIKATYGTGCFMLLNTGSKPVASQHRLLTTVGYRTQGTLAYALEGSIFMAGATMQWLRDKLQILKSTDQSEHIATSIGDNGGVYLIPAFTGLGAPHWIPEARAMILGMTRDTGIAHIVRAGLEAVAYQTNDLMEAMKSDLGGSITSLRTDGGMVANAWLMQFLANILGCEVACAEIAETSARGAAFLAGLGSGIFGGLSDIEQCWRANHSYSPQMEAFVRQDLLRGWAIALKKVL